MRFAIVAASLLFVAGSGPIEWKVTTVDAPGEPQRLAAGDLDADGDVDLFVVDDGGGQSATMEVLLNHGGQFVPGWSTVTNVDSHPLPWDIDLADTDNDGDADALFVVPYGHPRERFNDGSAHFDDTGILPNFSQRAQQEFADMNGDGDVDMIYYEEDIWGYFGTAQGHGNGSFTFDFSSETLPNLGPADLARRFELGDVDGDGLRDAVIVSKNGLQYIRGKPPAPGSVLPGFAPQQKLLVTPCLDVVLVDLDGDARLDIVATVPSQESVVVFLSHASHFGGPTFFPAGKSPDAIAAGDLDLDGAADVIVANTTTGSISVLHGSGAGALGAPQSRRVGRRPTDIAAADLDGDGDIDLAVSCAVSRVVTLLFNDSL